MRISATFLLAAASLAVAACDGPTAPPVNQAGSNEIVIDECTQADNRLCP